MLKLGDSTANDRNVNTTRIGSSGCGRGSGCDGRNSRGGRSSDVRRRRPVPDSPKQSGQKMAGKRYRSEMDCMDNQDFHDCTQQKQRIDGNQAEVEAGVATHANKRMRKSLLGTVMSLIGHSIRLFTPGRARVSATPSRSPTGGAGSPEQTHDAMVTAISESDSPGEVVFNSPGSDLSLLPTAVTARSGSHGPEHSPSKPPGGSIENGDDARGAVTRPVVVSPGALHDLAGASPSVSSLLSGRANPSELGFISRSPRPASDSNSKRVVPILAPVAPRTSMGAKMVRVGLRKSVFTSRSPSSSSWRVPEKGAAANVGEVRGMLLPGRLGGADDVRTAMGRLDDGVDLLHPSRRAELAENRLARERSVEVVLK